MKILILGIIMMILAGCVAKTPAPTAEINPVELIEQTIKDSCTLGCIFYYSELVKNGKEASKENIVSCAINCGKDENEIRELISEAEKQ